MIRGKPIAKGDYHLTVHICILNSEGQMLIQKRNAGKKVFPNRWDVTAAGSALAGETSKTAAERELFEELGLRLVLPSCPPAFSVGFPTGFDDFYIVKRDVDLSSLSLQTEEVSAVRWATLSEVFGMIDDGSFIPYRKHIVSLIFEGMNSIYKD
jgi:isopentenyldiphosphate isomerase